jgi:hypothetical protein
MTNNNFITNESSHSNKADNNIINDNVRHSRLPYTPPTMDILYLRANTDEKSGSINDGTLDS